MEEERLTLWKVLPYLPVHRVRHPFHLGSSERPDFAMQSIEELHPRA